MEIEGGMYDEIYNGDKFVVVYISTNSLEMICSFEFY